jgi:hypothetical protein
LVLGGGVDELTRVIGGVVVRVSLFVDRDGNRRWSWRKRERWSGSSSGGGRFVE